MITCTNCKSQNEEGSLFCGECGSSLKSETAVVPQPISVKSEPVSKTESNDKKEIHCRNCGKTLFADAFACTGCGLPPYKGKNHCQSCGAATNPEAVICIKCGVKLTNNAFSISNIGGSSSISSFQNNQATKDIGFWGAVLCFLGFFLPWLDIWMFSGNGFTAATKMLSDFAPIRIVLLAIPIISGVFIFNLLKGNSVNSLTLLKFIPLAILIITIIVIVDKLGGGRGNFGNGDEIFKIIGIGLYMTFIGAILLCFTKTTKP